MQESMLLSADPKSVRMLERLAASNTAGAHDLGVHHVVFQNGLDGNAGDWLRFISDAALADRRFKVVVSPVNQDAATHDGLEATSKRLASFLEQTVPEGPLSVVGHSMGGLVLRKALLALDAAGTLSRWDLRVMCTFSTPHLGIPRVWACVLRYFGACGCLCLGIGVPVQAPAAAWLS